MKVYKMLTSNTTKLPFNMQGYKKAKSLLRQQIPH